MLWLDVARVSPPRVLPNFVLHLEDCRLGSGCQCLQVWQDSPVLQKCNQHEVEAEGVESLHFVWEATLVPHLEEEGELDEADIKGCVGVHEVRICHLEQLVDRDVDIDHIQAVFDAQQDPRLDLDYLRHLESPSLLKFHPDYL